MTVFLALVLSRYIKRHCKRKIFAMVIRNIAAKTQLSLNKNINRIAKKFYYKDLSSTIIWSRCWINMLINNIVDEDCYLWWCTDKKGSMYLISTRILIAMRPNNEYAYGNEIVGLKY